MSSFQEKVNELQAEVEELDKRLTGCSKYLTYIFGASVATPFVLSFCLYMANPKFVHTDNQVDRKKIVKWAAIMTIVVWAGLYLLNMYMKKQSCI